MGKGEGPDDLNTATGSGLPRTKKNIVATGDSQT